MKTLRMGSLGTLVELLQSTLTKIGLYNRNIDGIFGIQTQISVMDFQKRSGLIADGIVGQSTWNSLHPYLNGYDWYSMKAGDSVYQIAQQYQSSVGRILTANSGIDVYNLQIGQKIVVPFGTIIPTDIRYSYQILQKNICALQMSYPFLEVDSIGKSELCRDIPCIRMGKGSKEVFYNGSFHANEWITTSVLMKFIENFSKAYAEEGTIYGHDARSIFDSTSIYIVPMVNPDGVDLVTGDIAEGMPAYEHAREIANDYSWLPFPNGWKANIKGTDLNSNYPANWERAREIKFARGYVGPAPRDYVGPNPLSAAESKAVYEFTLAHDFRLALAYHTQGRVIYWKYLGYLPPNSHYIGTRLSESSGYPLEETPYEAALAGYKDWFIQEYNLPAYTIEAGIGVNPLPIAQFDTIYEENEGMLVLGAVLAST